MGMIKAPNRKGSVVAKKRDALLTYQEKSISRVLINLAEAETDPEFE